MPRPTCPRVVLALVSCPARSSLLSLISLTQVVSTTLIGRLSQCYDKYECCCVLACSILRPWLDTSKMARYSEAHQLPRMPRAHTRSFYPVQHTRERAHHNCGDFNDESGDEVLSVPKPFAAELRHKRAIVLLLFLPLTAHLERHLTRIREPHACRWFSSTHHDIFR